MISAVLLATLAGLAGMIGWGSADFFAKKTIDKVGDIATLAWAHLYGVVILIAFVIGRSITESTPTTIPSDYKEIGGLVFFGILQALVYFFVYRGFAKGKLALLNPVFSAYSGIVVLLSVLIFGELIKTPQLAMLGVIFLGIMVINVDETSIELRRLKFSRIPGMKDILTAVALASVWTVLWGRFVSGKDWLVYAALMYILMSITIFVISIINKINLNVLDNKIWKYFLLIGFSEVIAYVGISWGYSLTSHLSIVAVLSAAFSVPTLILAHAFLGERITKLQILGAAFVILGVALVPLA